MVTPAPASAKTGGGTHPAGGSSGVKCSSCHEPHGSDFPMVLTKSADQLCKDCHAADVPRLAQSAHSPLTCTRCHHVHDSPSPNLLVASDPDLCTQCHAAGMYAQHPIGPGTWDFNAGEAMTCTSTCHDPHGATYRRMLRVAYNTDGAGSDYICLICHTRVGIDY
jgi:predicted CXXCH cytochrome family protein